MRRTRKNPRRSATGLTELQRSVLPSNGDSGRMQELSARPGHALEKAQRHAPSSGLRGARALVMVVQKPRQLFAQALVAHSLVSGDDGVLEQLFLDLLRQLGPDMDDGDAQGLGEPPRTIVRADVSHD